MHKPAILASFFFVAIGASAQQLIADFPQTDMSYVRSLALTEDSTKLVAVGDFSTMGGLNRDRMAVIDIATKQVLPFSASFNGNIQAVLVSGDTAYVFGDFTVVNGQERLHAAALNWSSSALLAWSPVTPGTVHSACKHGNTIYMGGTTGANSVSACTGAPLLLSVEASNTVYTIRYFNDRIYLGGIFTHVANQPRTCFAELDATTGQLTPLAPFVSTNIEEFIRIGDVVYFFGPFTVVGDSARHGMAALNATTGQVTSWNPGGSVSSMELINGTFYVAGDYSGNGFAWLHQIDPVSGIRTPWMTQGLVPYTNDIVATQNTLFVGGLFYQLGANPRQCLAAFQLNDNTDTDGDGIPDASDNCPAISGVIGSTCTDGDPNTINDALTGSCVCTGTSVITQLTTTAAPVISCGAIGLLIGSSIIYAVDVPGANKYQFSFTNVPGQPAYSRNIAMNSRLLPLTAWSTNPLKAGRSYQVKVRVSTDGGTTYYPYGNTCTISISYPPGNLRMGQGTTMQEITDLQVAPDPVSTDLLRLNGFMDATEALTASLEILDLQGRVVLREAVTVQPQQPVVVRLPAELANGQYMVRVRVKDVQRTTRWLLAR